MIKSKSKEEQTPASLVRQSKSLLSQAHCIEVVDDASYTSAGNFLAGVKTMINAILIHHAPMLEKAKEAQRKAKEVVDTIRGKQSEMLTPVEEAKGVVQRAMQGYLEERRNEQERIEKEIRIAEAAKEVREVRERKGLGSADTKTEVEIPEPLPERPKPIGTKVYRRWKFEIIDTSKIGAAFLAPDERAIRAVVETLHEKAEKAVGVGSIRVWMDEEVR